MVDEGPQGSFDVASRTLTCQINMSPWWNTTNKYSPWDSHDQMVTNLGIRVIMGHIFDVPPQARNIDGHFQRILLHDDSFRSRVLCGIESQGRWTSGRVDSKFSTWLRAWTTTTTANRLSQSGTISGIKSEELGSSSRNQKMEQRKTLKANRPESWRGGRLIKKPYKNAQKCFESCWYRDGKKHFRG